MPEISVETATIADAMVKAARVAPSGFGSGEVFTAGILIEFDENTNDVFVSSTDLNVFFRRRISGLQVIGSGCWRVAPVASKFLDSLPKSRGAVVTLTDTKIPGQLAMTQQKRRGETTGSVPLILNSAFPEWNPFSEDGSIAINGLASKIEAVAWAASKDDEATPELSGVYLDGNYAMATNRYVCASVPIVIPALADGPVTIPVKNLTGVIHHAGDVLLTKTEKGLGITPDEYTQVEVSRFAENKCGLLKLPNANAYNGSITVNVDEYKEVCDRIFTIIRKNQKARVKMLAAKDSLLFTIISETEEKVSDIIGATGGPDIPTLLSLNGAYARDAVTNSIGSHATLYFEQGLEKQKLFTYIQGGAGYEAWIAPQVEIEGA